MKYYTLTLTHKIAQIDGFDNETDLDKFGFETSSFTEEEKKKQRTAEGDMHGPPVVLVLVADNLDSVSINNFEQPFAVYLKGEKYLCVKPTQASKAQTVESKAVTRRIDRTKR